MISKKFLPIGTIVLLEESEEKVLIAGYLIGNQNYTYDYCGYRYPIGRTNKNSTLYFDKRDIIKVVSVGYIDDEVIVNSKKIEELANVNKRGRKS